MPAGATLTLLTALFSDVVFLADRMGLVHRLLRNKSDRIWLYKRCTSESGGYSAGSLRDWSFCYLATYTISFLRL